MRILALALAFLLPTVALAKKAKAPARMVVKEAPTGDLFATFQTDLGDIVVKLFEKDAPKAVDNFVSLATGKKEWKDPSTGQWVTGKPFYDGTAFHRVIPGFMIQGGDPNSGPGQDPAKVGNGSAGRFFEDEFHNGHDFSRPGMLAMANSGPNTNGSQFFLTEVPTEYLNDKHTIFGEVVSGQELIARIANAGDMKTRLNHLVIQRGALGPETPTKTAAPRNARH